MVYKLKIVFIFLKTCVNLILLRSFGNIYIYTNMSVFLLNIVLNILSVEPNIENDVKEPKLHRIVLTICFTLMRSSDNLFTII